MKSILLVFSMIVLRCCWGSTEYKFMQNLQNNSSILKTLDGKYTINTLNGEDVSAFNLNIVFNDDTKQVSGFSGCNRFFGSYDLNGNTLGFSDLGATKMLCSDDKNKIEQKLLKVFDNADTVFFSEHGFSLFNKKKLLLSASKTLEEDKLTFEYSAHSRGSYKNIKINKDHITLSKEKGGKILKMNCDSLVWNAISKASKQIDLENIPNIQAPSKSFQFDGAALARLKITSNGKTYESQPFDHGNPPEEIVALVKEILSLTEKIE